MHKLAAHTWLILTVEDQKAELEVLHRGLTFMRHLRACPGVRSVKIRIFTVNARTCKNHTESYTAWVEI